MHTEAALAQTLSHAVERGGDAKYARLQEALARMILEGALQPGLQLPSDKSLAEQVGVSLGTVQKALTNLQKRGLVTRAPRRGTVVADRAVSETDVFVFRFREADTGNLILPKVRTLSVEMDDRDGPWRQFLQTDNIVRFERLLQIGVEPPVYSEVFIPAEHGRGLLGRPLADFAGFSVHRHIESCHGAPTLRSESKVRIGSFAPHPAAQLMRDEGSANLTWEVSSYTLGDRPASYQRIQIPPDHRPLEFRRSFGE